MHDKYDFYLEEELAKREASDDPTQDENEVDDNNKTKKNSSKKSLIEYFAICRTIESLNEKGTVYVTPAYDRGIRMLLGVWMTALMLCCFIFFQFVMLLIFE